MCIRDRERSADAAQEGIVVGVRGTEESEFADGHRDVRAASVSEVVDGQGDVHAASVVEVDEVEVEEKFGGSIVECASENDVVCEDVQCSDGGSGRDGDDVDDESVEENEIGEEVSEEVCEAVSYTHLDVYKRQPLYCKSTDALRSRLMRPLLIAKVLQKLSC